MNTLLNNLRVWQKLAVLGLLGVLLLGLPLTLYLQAKYTEWAFARQEATGVEPAQLLLKLVQLTQQQRGIAMQGDEATQRDARHAEIEQAFVALQSAGSQVLAHEKLQKPWAAATQSWRSIKSQTGTSALRGNDGFAAYSAMLDKQFDVLELIRDTTNLSLDPDADGYFLHLFALVDLPAAQEQLSVARAQGVQLLQTPHASDADRAKFLTTIERVRLLHKAATRTLEKAMDYAPSLRASLQGVRSQSDASVGQLLTLSEEQIARNQNIGLSPNQYMAQGDLASNHLARVNALATAELASIIDQRSARIARNAVSLGGGVLLLACAAAWLGVLIARSMTRPVQRLTETVKKFAQGHDAARVQLRTREEFGELGNAFDQMMDERVASQVAIQKENERLNDSVLRLLQGVAQLARRDLTAKVEVADDVTGPVADALNLLSGETAKVMQKVSDISADVSQASLLVKQQSDTVQAVADSQREQAEATATSLETASETMLRIADLAQLCNAAGERATLTTAQALQTVNGTVGGINSTRDTIRETEKRIKRLGERSQEISVAVGLINTIAERTHILALNAAMHAASAGEAGRGFAVVADEVQRLAESARQATQQIAGLVGNIQVETADTVNTMNMAIAQVVEGSKLAEQAGQQMQVTQETTAELVASVQRIASESRQQAAVSQQLIERASLSKQSSLKTHTELAAQAEQTGRLVEYAKNLLTAVRVFKLSAS